MKNKMLKFIPIVLSVVFLLSVVILATGDTESPASGGSMSLAEAKEYLLNYEETGFTEDGLGYRTTIEFESEEDLLRWADYLAKNGTAEFWEKVNTGISEELARYEDEDKANHERIMRKLADQNPYVFEGTVD